MQQPVTDAPEDEPQTGDADAVLRELLGYHIKRAQSAIQADLNAALKPLDLRMLTFSALAVVASSPGLRQAQLADALSIERPNLVVILDELERRGLILRDRVPTDRRAYALKATLEGRRLFEAAQAAVRAHEAALFTGISPEDQVRLREMMQRIWRAGEGARE